ncbi:hypothetical protein [Cupriavidus sp. CuC1]|uniref:hypothetical protein n=1 Tax=Cupriavidus sp. CuC1 TaxID=3373131 RepID=UPI0037D08520
MTGLRPQGEPSTLPRILSTNFLHLKTADEKSFLTVVKQTYLYRLPSTETDVTIDAIEITWSPLTQWIKTTQLRYDDNGDFKDDSLPCLESKDNPFRSAPSRALLNGYVKEHVFDRSLADAALYMGSYGTVLQRGVADALCHALTDQSTDMTCVWPPPSDNDRTRYIFLTHSLGSRIIYDTLLGLQGHASSPSGNVFTDDEWGGSRPFVQRMMANTPVVYMMANQLALLGLANEHPLVISQDGPQPYARRFDMPWLKVPEGVFVELPKGQGESDDLSMATCTNPLKAFGQARAVAQEVLRQTGEVKAGASPAQSLTVVAFNDTNDLLSWAIPEWYVRKIPGDPCMPDIKVTNVFVNNATRWLGLLEDPAAAHTGYFQNARVWDVIRCGADQGVLLSCKF